MTAGRTPGRRVSPSHFSRASRIAAKRDLLEHAARDYYAAMVSGQPHEARQDALGSLAFAARAFVRAENGDDE